MNNTDFMERALQIARRAQGLTSPNPLVGSVIVKKGKIIAEGWHKICGGDHAEVTAIKKAGHHAKGAMLYLTLEPCFHYGRTPPCVDLIIHSGIKKVVVAMKDPNPLTNGKSLRKLRRHGLKVRTGVCKNEAEKLNEGYVKYITTKMPFVSVKSAQTLDGKIATSRGDSKWITSMQARAFARQIRNEFDGICVGINTVLTDDPGLNPGLKSKRIKKIICDSSLRISLQAKLFSGCRPHDCIIATTKKASLAKIKTYQDKGITVWVCPQSTEGIKLRWLFKKLAIAGMTSILIEGGAHLIGSALQENVVDKMYFYIAPKIIGDQNALSAVVGLNTLQIKQSLHLQNMEVTTMGRDILVTGYVYRNR